MPSDRHIVLYHAHPSRSTGAHALLQELGADYEIRPLAFDADGALPASFRAVNPLGKVPTIQHGDAVITEQVAIYLYLADLYPEAGLAPPIGDALRGPYLRWMALYGSSFEPAMADRAMKRESGPRGMSPYGSADDVAALVCAQLAGGPYLLGERMYAVDVLWGGALGWMTRFGLFPADAAVSGYVARMQQRPAFRSAMKDAD